MLLCKVLESPARAVPIAMMLLTTGLMLLVCGIAWPHLGNPVFHLSQQWSDFWNGFLYGLAITLEASAVVLLLAFVVRRNRENAS